MFIEERHRAILEILSTKGSITTGEIQEQFQVSYDSAKRDLRIKELFISASKISISCISHHCMLK